MMLATLRRWQTETGDAYVVSLVRAVLGVLLALSSLRELAELRTGAYFGDVFHMPIVPESLVPGRGLFTAIAVAELGLAVLVTMGRLARPALLASALLGIYLLLCDRLSYHNNRYALFLFSFLLAFAPCDRAFVVGALRRDTDDPGRSPAGEARTGPLWAQRLAQLQLAIIYIGSGGSKLLDPDWRGGLVLGDRLARSAQMAAARGVPPELMRVLGDPSVASTISKVAIGTELFLAIALFVPRTRFFALWWGLMFHVTIEITSQVELFGWLSVTIYALFAVPRLRERKLLFDPRSKLASGLAWVVRRLDWLARFEVRAEGGERGTAAFVVLGRDGAASSGLGAVAGIARAIPAFFALSVPLFVLEKLAGRGPRAAIAANPAK
jgi:hypothetical protein